MSVMSILKYFSFHSNDSDFIWVFIYRNFIYSWVILWICFLKLITNCFNAVDVSSFCWEIEKILEHLRTLLQTSGTCDTEVSPLLAFWRLLQNTHCTEWNYRRPFFPSPRLRLPLSPDANTAVNQESIFVFLHHFHALMPYLGASGISLGGVAFCVPSVAHRFRWCSFGDLCLMCVQSESSGASAACSHVTDVCIGPCAVGAHHIVFIPLCWTLDIFSGFSVSTGVAGSPWCTRALGHVPSDGVPGRKGPRVCSFTSWCRFFQAALTSS